jgi:hypothetical protein
VLEYKSFINNFNTIYFYMESGPKLVQKPTRPVSEAGVATTSVERPVTQAQRLEALRRKQVEAQVQAGNSDLVTARPQTKKERPKQRDAEQENEALENGSMTALISNSAETGKVYTNKNTLYILAEQDPDESGVYVSYNTISGKKEGVESLATEESKSTRSNCTYSVLTLNPGDLTIRGSRDGRQADKPLQVSYEISLNQVSNSGRYGSVESEPVNTNISAQDFE